MPPCSYHIFLVESCDKHLDVCLGNRKECFSVHSNRGICSAQPAQPTNPSFHGLHNQRNKHDNFWCNKGGDQTLNSRFGPKGTGGASKTDEFSGKLQTAIDPRLIFGKSWQTSRAAYNGPKQQCFIMSTLWLVQMWVWKWWWGSAAGKELETSPCRLSPRTLMQRKTCRLPS